MSNAVNAYPLAWPVGYKRTEKPRASRFSVSITKACFVLRVEIQRLGGSAPIISSNIPLRNDGLPRSNYKKLDDNGVAVYFTYKSSQMVFCCDRWNDVADNLQAICKSIEALRGLERWGVSDMLDRAFMGFKALTSESVANPESWWQVLGIDEHATADQIRKAYLALAKLHHPDTGGNKHDFARINEAYKAATAPRP